MALQGTIDTFEFTEVVRLLAAGGKTGVLRLEGSRGSGRLWVDGGKVTAIEVDHAPRAEGHAEAMFELLRFDDGSFTFVSGEQAADAGDPADMEEILADAEAQLAEWREIERVVPTTRATIGLRPELSRADVVLDRQRWRLVAAIGGGVTVATIGERLGLGELPVSRAVKELIELGVVDLDDTVAEEPLPVAVVAEPVPVAIDEVVPVMIETEPVLAAPSGRGGSARAQLDEFAAGFGLSDPAYENVVDAAPIEDAAPPPGPGAEGFSDFGVDSLTSGPAPFGDGAPGGDGLSELSLGFEAESAGPETGSPAPVPDGGPFLGGGGDAAEVARQLSNLSPAAARAVAAAAKATTDEEREAALAAVTQEGDEPIDRELLARFLASVKS